MSIKVWAKNKETGEILHINSVDKSYKGKMVCLDENCGEVLNICIGEKKKPYFSHNKNCSCNGGGVETLLHLLSKQILSKCKEFVIPEESLIFRGKKLLFNNKIKISVGSVSSGELLEKGFRTGTKLVSTEGVAYYIEASMRGISAGRRQAYNSHKANVIEIDLRKFSGSENIDEKELEEFITGYTGIKSFACSSNIFRVNTLIKESEYISNGDLTACPVKGYMELVRRRDCRRCPFFLYVKDGATVCTGKGCYSDTVDFKISDKSLRMDKYLEIIPESVYAVDRFYKNHPLGYCSKCSHKIEIGISESNPVIVGAYNVSWDNDYFAYLVCPSCKKTKPLICPHCGGRMRLCRNSRTGSVFICCENYNNAASESECDCSLTIFNKQPCGENFADELLSVGSIDNFLSSCHKVDKTTRNTRKNKRTFN